MTNLGNMICLKKLWKISNVKTLLLLIFVIFFTIMITGMVILPDESVFDDLNYEIGKVLRNLHKKAHE